METTGLIIVHTGNGKGKTTAALGMAFRAWGDGLRVLILQFIKGNMDSGELHTIDALDDRIEIRPLGLGFTQPGKEKEKHRQAAQQALKTAHQEMLSGHWDLLILDEINYAIQFSLIEESAVLRLLEEKPASLHMVLTGRDARPAIIEKADLVTEMHLVKHPYEKGIPAQKGIEF